MMKAKMIKVSEAMAREEIEIHSQLSHPNIVSLVSASESEEDFCILMDWCNDATYFEEKIMNVRFTL